MEPTRVELAAVRDITVHLDVFEANSTYASHPPAIVYFFRKEGNTELHYAKCQYLASRGMTCICA